MRGIVRSLSFTFLNERRWPQETTDNAENTFREVQRQPAPPSTRFQSIRASRRRISAAVASLPVLPARQAIRRGARRIAGTLDRIRDYAQRLREPNNRRQRLNEDPSDISPVSTPLKEARARRILGRTPTKLYSPFGIETPRRRTPRRRSSFHSPGHNRLRVSSPGSASPAWHRKRNRAPLDTSSRIKNAVRRSLRLKQ